MQGHFPYKQAGGSERSSGRAGSCPTVAILGEHKRRRPWGLGCQPSPRIQPYRETHSLNTMPWWCLLRPRRTFHSADSTRETEKTPSTLGSEGRGRRWQRGSIKQQGQAEQAKPYTRRVARETVNSDRHQPNASPFSLHLPLSLMSRQGQRKCACTKTSPRHGPALARFQ